MIVCQIEVIFILKYKIDRKHTNKQKRVCLSPQDTQKINDALK